MFSSRLLPLLLVLALGLGAVIAILLLLVGGPVWLAVVVGVLVAAAVLFAVLAGAERLALGRLATRPAHEAEFPRLYNLVETASLTHGFAFPSLLVIDAPTLNAAVVGRGPDHASFVFTSALLDSLDVVELEAVLGHAFHIAAEEDLFTATLAVPLARIFGRPLTQRGLGGRHRVFRGDLEGVRLTRYPPGLAAALSRLERGSTEVPGATLLQAHLWFVQPSGLVSDGSDTHPPIGERVDALREL